MNKLAKQHFSTDFSSCELHVFADLTAKLNRRLIEERSSKRRCWFGNHQILAEWKKRDYDVYCLFNAFSGHFLPSSYFPLLDDDWGHNAVLNHKGFVSSLKGSSMWKINAAHIVYTHSIHSCTPLRLLTYNISIALSFYLFVFWE